MIPNILYSGCGLCYNEEYDTQIKEGVIDMKKEDKAIHAWKSKNATLRASSRASSRASRSKQTRFTECDDEEYSQSYSSQTYRLRPRKHGRGRGRWDSSTVSSSARKMQVESNLLQRNLRAAQKELLVQDKMIIQLESDLQVHEIEHSKLEDKLYLMQLDLEDAQTALRREVLRNQETERMLQEYQRMKEEQRQQWMEEEQRQGLEQQARKQPQQQNDSWFSLW